MGTILLTGGKDMMAWERNTAAIAAVRNPDDPLSLHARCRMDNCVLPAIFSFFVTPISDFFESSEIGSRVFGDIGLPTLEHTSPFRHSTMRKGRKKRALRIAEKLLVRLLTQYFPLTSDSTLGGWCA